MVLKLFRVLVSVDLSIFELPPYQSTGGAQDELFLGLKHQLDVIPSWSGQN